MLGGVILESNDANRLKNVQNKVITILFGSCFNYNLDKIYFNLNILKVDDVYKYNVLITTQNIINKKSIEFLYNRYSNLFFNHDYNTRGNRLRLPTCELKMVKFNLIYRSIIEYNKLPDCVVEIESISVFKKENKSLLINKYVQQ